MTMKLDKKYRIQKRGNTQEKIILCMENNIRTMQKRKCLKLKNRDAKDLYSYWGNTLAEHIFVETDCIINLASKEYSVCVSNYLHPGIRFITCVFGEEKDGKIIEKGTMCKMARGEMVRYMAEYQIENPEEIRSFDRLDYAFDSERSDENTYVFVKRGKTPCSLD